MNVRINIGTYDIQMARQIRKGCQEYYRKNRIAGQDVKIILRGRGSRQQYGDRQDLPIRYAKKAAVYVVFNEREADFKEHIKVAIQKGGVKK